MIFKRIEISEWKMLVCFLGVQTYLNGRCLFAFYVFRRKEMSERKVAFLFSMCFRRIEFLHKKKASNCPNDHIEISEQKLLICILCFL